MPPSFLDTPLTTLRRAGQRLVAVLLLASLAACSLPPPPPQQAFTASVHFEGKALALAQAVDRKDAAEVKRLIHAEGVNPDTAFGKHALPMAAWPVLNQNLDGLRLLLDNGADPNARRHRPDGSALNNAMVYAAREPDQRFLTLLLDHGGDPNAKNSNNESLTFVAWLRDQWPNVQLLIMRGADVNHTLYGDSSDTPAAWYSRLGDFEQVYWLLQHGADPTVKLRGVPGVSPMDRMPIAEDIYYLPVQPRVAEWQRKCQRWLMDRGIKRPPMPEMTKRRRIQFGLPVDLDKIPQG